MLYAILLFLTFFPDSIDSHAAPCSDPVTQLAKVWVLKDQLVLGHDSVSAALPVPDMVLIFYPDSTYSLLRGNQNPNAVNGEVVTENGYWEFDPVNGFIGVMVMNVDGRACRSAMAYRWIVRELLPERLILRQVGIGVQYLIFEVSKE